MMPRDAKQALLDMGVAVENELGFFRVVRSPRIADLDAFVLAIKTLGSWSTVFGRNRVEVQCGKRSDDIIFKLSEDA